MPVDVTLHLGIGFPNLCDVLSPSDSPSHIFAPAGTIGWDADSPLDSLFTREFSDPARSTGVTANHTQFVVDHGSSVSAQALVLAGHNLTSAATIAWQRGSTPTGGATGSISARAAWQITPLVRDGRDHHIILVLPASAAGRYDWVRIVDTANPAGFIELARLGILPMFVPAYNASYGLRHGFRTMSGAERTPGSGASQRYKQRVLRTEQFLLEWLTPTEGDTLHELQRVADITEEVLYVPHMSSPAAQQRYGMLGQLEEIPGSELPRVNTNSVGFRVTQVA